MQISKRLRAVADLVTSGCRLADVGTDHAYLPIFLIENQRIPHAVAMDVNEGPLARARSHIAARGLSDKIEIRRSDGLERLAPGEAESLVIAGMGGLLTIRILAEGESRLCGCRELILQPQSEIRRVRAYLQQKAWRIVREDMVCEDGKYYPVMRAVRMAGTEADAGTEPLPEKPRPDAGGFSFPSGLDAGGSSFPSGPDAGGSSFPSGLDAGGSSFPSGLDAGGSSFLSGPDAPLTELELYCGPCLLRERHPVLREYLLRERELCSRILRALEEQGGAAALRRAGELRRELRLIEEGLRRYSGETGQVLSER